MNLFLSDDSRRRRSALSLAALVLTWSTTIACVYSPQTLRDREGLAPHGEISPAPNAPTNPLDSPSKIEVTCSPQGKPVVDSEPIRRCEEDPDCEIVCGAESTSMP